MVYGISALIGAVAVLLPLFVAWRNHEEERFGASGPAQKVAVTVFVTLLLGMLATAPLAGLADGVPTAIVASAFVGSFLAVLAAMALWALGEGISWARTAPWGSLITAAIVVIWLAGLWASNNGHMRPLYFWGTTGAVVALLALFVGVVLTMALIADRVATSTKDAD